MKLERATVRRFLLGVMVPLAITLLASYIIYRFILANNDSLRAISQSYQRISALNMLYKTVLDAETGMRGFVITGNESFLEPYNNSVIDVGSELGTLRGLIRDDDSVNALTGVDTTFEEWRREIAEVVIHARRTFPAGLASEAARAHIAFLEARRAEARYRQGPNPEALMRWGRAISDTQSALENLTALRLQGATEVQTNKLSSDFRAYSVRVSVPEAQPSPADERAAEALAAALHDFSLTALASEQELVGILQAGGGKLRIDRIRAYITSIERRTDATLQGNLESGETDTQLAQTVSFAGPLAASIVSLIAVIWSQRALSRSARRLTEATEEVSAGQLDKRLRVVRGEELWQLTRNFNTMAAELSARERQANLFRQMGKMLQTCSDSSELNTITSHFAAELFPSLSGALYVISASRNLLQCSASWGDFPADERVHTPQECWAIRQGQPQFAERGGSENDIFCQHAPQPAPYESLCIPLTSQDETLGVLFLYTTRADRPLKDGTQRLAATVAEQLALALSNLRLREKLRHQSIRDPLTGLFNRRHLEETLDLELHRAARRGEPVSLVMFDVDHFKRYNDTFGHDAGDSVLRHMSGLAQRHIRAGDVACRYGGEEFLLVQPGMSAENALERAESLREAVTNLGLEHQGQRLGQITISLGVATYPDHAPSGTELIKRADEALYRAKREGRNRTVQASGETQLA